MNDSDSTTGCQCDVLFCMVVTVSCSELMAGGMGRMAGIQLDSLAGGITEIWSDSLQAGGLAEMRSDSLDISTYFPILHFLNKIELEETHTRSLQ